MARRPLGPVTAPVAWTEPGRHGGQANRSDIGASVPIAPKPRSREYVPRGGGGLGSAAYLHQGAVGDWGAQRIYIKGRGVGAGKTMPCNR